MKKTITFLVFFLACGGNAIDESLEIPLTTSTSSSTTSSTTTTTCDFFLVRKGPINTSQY